VVLPCEFFELWVQEKGLLFSIILASCLVSLICGPNFLLRHAWFRSSLTFFLPSALSIPTYLVEPHCKAQWRLGTLLVVFSTLWPRLT
jgi:hypothetical protein